MIWNKISNIKRLEFKIQITAASFKVAQLSLDTFQNSSLRWSVSQWWGRCYYDPDQLTTHSLRCPVIPNTQHQIRNTRPQMPNTHTHKYKIQNTQPQIQTAQTTNPLWFEIHQHVLGTKGFLCISAVPGPGLAFYYACTCARHNSTRPHPIQLVPTMQKKIFILCSFHFFRHHFFGTPCSCTSLSVSFLNLLGSSITLYYLFP